MARSNVNKVLEELENTVSGPPLCSIVIPVHNCVDLTRQCLAAVKDNTDGIPYEVVVVDDGSTDGTAEFLAELKPPFRSISNDGNLGFARSCNAGAWATTGEYVLFLNNDTVPLPGWLLPMIECMQEHRKAGIVGSKLLYPDKDLIQHAGLAFDERKDPYHIYRCLPSDFPEVNLERECQAVTGACFLVRRSLFTALDGFDVVFRNGLEDVDFCLRARERGYEVWYCPASVVYHYESMSPGRLDDHARNAGVFFKRWGEKISPDPDSARQLLLRVGRPLLKVNAKGDKFVMFREKTLYICDHRRWKSRTYANVFSLALARLCYSVRYWEYRRGIRELRRLSRDTGKGESPASQVGTEVLSETKRTERQGDRVASREPSGACDGARPGNAP